mmetsp:Transcript_4680/g.6827  ORF Transcript_4680/g.6827 Transcript_4680/m.6827 type:complete len:135 (+) Transcript_4680:129-533(+)
MGLLFGAIATGISKECFVHSTFRIQLPFLDGKNNMRRKDTNILFEMKIMNHDADENDNDSDGTGRYTPTKHSEEFLSHLESVKSSWPYNDDVDEDAADQTIDNNSDYSVYCTGEPCMDPSRMLQSISDDDYDWV